MTNSNTVPNSFGISNKVLLGTSGWINSDNLLPCVRSSGRTYVRMDWLLSPTPLLFFASVTDSRLHIYMKPFAISESHYPLYLKFQWENKVKEDYKPEKKASDQRTGRGLAEDWQKTDSIHITASRCVRLYNFRNCTLLPCFSTREKQW